MQSFQFIVLTPPCLPDPSIAIAASRAGAIGIADLEYTKNAHDKLNIISRLTRYVRKGCGIKLSSKDDCFKTIISGLPRQVDIAVLTCDNPEMLHKQVQLLRSKNITVLLEATSLEQAQLGNAAGADGIVAKGNEAGGLVGEETAFILLQQLLKSVSLPVFVQGGIGLHTAAACYAGGAAGVVLDMQLALTRESTLPETVKTVVAHMDGSETICMGSEIGNTCRMYSRAGLPILQDLSAVINTLATDPRPRPEILADFRQEVKKRAGWGDPGQHIWLLGQDTAFAAPLAQRFHTVGGILDGFRQAIASHVRTAKTLRPLGEGSPLGRSHNTRYPIVQGPMARISDTPAFAARVAEEGALPFLAISMLDAHEIREILEETKRLLGNRPWGVGMLGFISPDLLRKQLDVIRTYKPPFALIAGGRPDQSHALEKEGIHTYLHVPSPGLLRMFIESGARRFIFEGSECGGHVGPRSSFALWNPMIDVLTESLHGKDMADCHVLFAGGIHDALSASMVATMAAPLAEQGAKIGVLLGTAYLFTEEAVYTGAIVRTFQEEAIKCTKTVLMESGPGHAARCADTPYTRIFAQEKLRLAAEGASVEKIRNVLEELNLGRLRTASKGIIRNPRYGENEGASKYILLSAEEQHNQGMYMLGQLAALRDRPCAVKDIHYDVAVKGSERLEALTEFQPTRTSASREAKPSNVAIIGMACILPKAGNLKTYWENILNKVDAITEIPKDRWDWQLYFSQDRNARDKVYSKWGGFIEPVPFNPTKYGMPPNTLSSIEPLQLLTLEVVQKAIEDAGYSRRPFPRERTSVILGSSGGISDLGQLYSFRSNLPMFIKDIPPDALTGLPEWTEDSFAGILLNVAAGRVANRFDLGGVNYTVDAACASSLAAVYLAVRELENETSDMVIVGGTDTLQNPFSYLCFSKTQALSPRGRCRTFDESADGIVISEGIAILVLKRLSDAERDGDRIYAVIKAVSGSSDGRDKGLTAPRPEGQALALKRTYEKAGFSPTTVGLIEAHGTGTAAGDRAEIETLKRIFEAAGAAHQSCAIGSVKSMIGHTKSTAGVASLIKVALSLYYKVLPPTIGVDKPNPILAGSPFYVNTEARPWICGITEQPRRASVSAFGFGGTNFHATLEEYTGSFLPISHDSVLHCWPGELFLLTGHSPKELIETADKLSKAILHGAHPALRDLAYTLWKHSKKDRHAFKLAIVAGSLEDLQQKLTSAGESLKNPGCSQIHDPKGIYFTDEPIGRESKVAFLFPGQGSQYPDMLRDLAILFHEVRERFELADRTLSGRFPRPLSAFIFPPPCFSKEEEQTSHLELTKTNIAQPSLGAADMGLFHLLQTFGIKPSMVAGHSYGEYVALCAAGVFSEEILYALSEARGRFIMEMAGQDSGTMVAVEAVRETVKEVISTVEGVWIANLNAPRQTIISGTRPGIEEAVKRLEAQGMRTRSIPVSCAFHSPLMAPAQDRLAEFLSTIEVAPPMLDVFSNTTASSYPQNAKDITALLSKHLVQPVEFAGEIEAMYRAGARIFIEAGPRNVLTGLTHQILEGQPYLAVALSTPGRSGIIQLLHALGQLAVHGVHLQLDRLYQGREVRQLKLDALVEETREKPLPPTTMLVDGSRVRPLYETAQARREQNAGVYSNTPVRSIPTGNAEIHTSNEEDRDVILQFQKLMNRFLDVQQQVMLAYLRGSNGEQIPESVASDLFKTMLNTSPQAQTSSSSQLAEPSPLLSKKHAPTKTVLSSPDASATSAPGHTGHVLTQEQRPSFNKEQLTEQLLRVVSERTGYPPEMLGLDLNIEADLGVDSIKRVEILGALQRAYLSNYGEIQMAMEELTKIKTLRGIIDYIGNIFQSQPEAKTDKPTPDQHAPATARTFSEGNNKKVEVSRCLLTSTDTPINKQPLSLPTGSVFIITDDERGIAHTLSDKLRNLGGRVVLVRMGDKTTEVEAYLYTADLKIPTGVADLVALVRKKHGPITGIIHLLPLKKRVSFEEMDMKNWKDRICLETIGLFYLAKAAGHDLKQAAETGGGWLVAATELGGVLPGHQKEFTPIFPGQGGIAGLIKTLTLEWPHVCCKVIHFGNEGQNPTIVDNLLCEMTNQDKQVEVVYRDSRRFILKPMKALLDQNIPANLTVDSSWVILITGGARGITAEVACELARRYQPVIILVGRSPLPASYESPETAELVSPQELKTAFINQMRRSGQSVTPAQVETACTHLLHEREMRNNLTAMRQAGATVRYYQIDVCNEEAFSSLIDEIYRSYGRLDGVVHGAGIIEDKLIEDKTPESFNRVFYTKVGSAFILSRKLRPDSLRFLIFFSSVAGCFGNRGQCDYAAANEVLNKLAVYLDCQWPGRVVAINWGPWEKTGMVSAEARRQFEERGVELIPSGAGCDMLDKELKFGRKGEVEIVVGNGPWVDAGAAPAYAPPDVFPLLNGIPLRRRNSGTVEFVRTLDPAFDLYLQDHRLDGKPVLPMTVAMELMSEVVQKTWPERQITGMRSLNVLRGIVVEDGAKEIRVVARPQSDASCENSTIEIAVEIYESNQSGHPGYRAVVQTEKQLPSPVLYEYGELRNLHPFPKTVRDIYRHWLFHGPCFQNISSIEGFNQYGICAILVSSLPAQCLSQHTDSQWLIDPVLLDCGLQLALLWERVYYDMTPLPTGFKSYRRFGSPSGSSVRCYLRAYPSAGGHILFADICFLDTAGRMLAFMEGVEASCSKALNRLAGVAESVRGNNE
ncbi:MAG: SDR family NAD(P)-dependent oxidoreductase [Candidatus Brocadia sp.]|jgi:acyl transferase domain-containing protein/NAD(P)H-dependent flavin oxidoreductase YrpB (nitropropane dioxygenase family)/NAD(P)-dependent dehydrogenase (short-subunit alcohol dehydrogenase family)